MGLRLDAGPRTDRLERTVIALRTECAARLSAEQDETMAQVDPMRLGHALHKVLFDRNGFPIRGQAQAECQAFDVGIHNHSRRLSERHPEHDVSRLSAHAGQRRQRIEIGRDIAAMLFDKLRCHRNQVLGLGTEEPGRVDQRLELGLVGGGQCAGVGITCEQRGGHHIDPDVGALRGEDRRDDQLERIAMPERTLGPGIESLEGLDHAARLKLALFLTRSFCTGHGPLSSKGARDRAEPVDRNARGAAVKAARTWRSDSAQYNELDLLACTPPLPTLRARFCHTLACGKLPPCPPRNASMDDDFDLRGFTNVCRLFPLPNGVLFPHSVLPLHIFEPRYRQMTEDAVKSDKLVTLARYRPTNEDAPAGEPPPLESVACLGQIVQHEKLPDGRFNFLLLGRKRVRLKREIPSGKLYRIAEVEILEDSYGDEPEEPRRSEFCTLFRTVFELKQAQDVDLGGLLDSQLPLGPLTDIAAHAMGLPPELAQLLLAEPEVNRRLDALLEILRRVRSSEERKAGRAARPFPPPFSSN